MEENIFGEFALATLTFGLYNSPSEKFSFAYLFTSVPISIQYPLNCRRVVPAPDGTIYLVDINETHYWGSF